VATSVSASEYAGQVDSFFDKESFFEVDTSRHIDRYANIVLLFSLYESRHDPKDPKPYVRGINSFQLFLTERAGGSFQFSGRRGLPMCRFQDNYSRAMRTEKICPGRHD
jgi:hypothetical protein